MSYLSAAQIEAVRAKLETANKRLESLKEKATVVAERVKTVAEVAGGGLAAGYLDGRLGAAPGGAVKEGHVSVMGFQFVPSVAAGALLCTGSFLEIFGKNSEDALAVGSGMLAGTAYSFANATGKAGKAKGTIFGASSPELIGAQPDFSAAVGLDSVLGRAHGHG
jgi:hypothetical protein